MKENLVEQIIKMADRYDDYMDYRCVPVEFFKAQNKDKYSRLRFIFGSYDSVLLEIKSAENSFLIDERHITFSKENINLKTSSWFYDISINPPIISMLTIIFLALVNVNILIGLENNYKDFKNINNTKEKLFVFIKMLFNAILFLFFLANSVILYTKL